MNTNTLRNLGARKKHPSFVINRLGNAPINTTICQWFNVTQIYSLSPYRSHLHQQDPHTGWSRLHVATARCATDSLCHCFRKGEPLWNKPWKVYLLRQELVRVTSVHISSARTSNMGLLFLSLCVGGWRGEIFGKHHWPCHMAGYHPWQPGCHNIWAQIQVPWGKVIHYKIITESLGTNNFPPIEDLTLVSYK